MPNGQLVAEFTSAYPARGMIDDVFSIEVNGDYVGECGVEWLPMVNDPDRVAGAVVWLFERNSAEISAVLLVAELLTRPRSGGARGPKLQSVKVPRLGDVFEIVEGTVTLVIQVTSVRIGTGAFDEIRVRLRVFGAAS